MVDGVWHGGGLGSVVQDGEMKWASSVFRHRIATNGDARFRPEVRRYHLYVSLACPWAHRTLIFRALKGLEDIVGISVAHWPMLDEGWTFEPGPGVMPDTANEATRLHEIYSLAGRDCLRRLTTLRVVKRNYVIRLGR